MKHKHFEMIVAKAGNMDLVVFSQNQKDNSWLVQNDQGTTDFGDLVNYFLCLPQHKDACLHWLNGGELYINNGKGLGEGNYTLSIKTHKPLSDFIGHPEYQFHIKPKKEKRWIVLNYKLNVVSSNFCKSLEDARAYVSNHFAYPDDVQYIEIEVEV